ncbi:50S ribosomal protein L25 [Aneurinibacillus sp. Ricciae_BoGa-3]|uniref:50S ribosomal protein L25 n=1 Tax=Aneurinibacillus sp. Ricciae_BoGa-3 TaxID=3022697 RepID=UPI002340A2A5|nr:50S ribosomal protein L25 [Aneurinibacillus sp. Ricciae_BoGa-3]WCK54726.1 50S ribosomal protein L25 [Aneurinibacillus sp. Ricciae_BoGa-3]
MMNSIQLEAHPRTILTKGERNRLRREGHVPGVLYGKGTEAQAIYITGNSFRQVNGHGNILVDVNLEGEHVSAMINEIAYEIMKHRPLHIDMHAVNLNEPINAEVPVVLDGLQVVESKGAIVQQQTREVAVRCLPTNVPESITHNIANLAVGDTMHAGDLTLPTGVTLHTDPEEVICTITEVKNATTDTEIEPKEQQLVHDTEGKGE